MPLPPDPLWQLIFEGSSEGVIVCDATGQILAANPRAADRLGLAASAVVGCAITDFLPSDAVTASPFPGPGGIRPLVNLRLRRSDGMESPVAAEVRALPDRRRVIFLRELRDRQHQEQCLSRVNAALLDLGDDFERNVQMLTAVAGELLAADCALYNRLDGNLLCARGQWQPPPGFKAEDAPAGHLCFDVIRQASGEARVIPHLPDTPYFRTDPNVAAYGLQTYVGVPVKFAGKHRGSLCVVYTHDRRPSADDLRILGLLAAAIGQEEERTRALAALQIKDRAIEASIAAIALADLHGSLTYVNPAFLALWGCEGFSEVLGRQATEFWQNPSEAEQVIAALATDGSWVGELVGRRKDGTNFCAQLSATQMKDTAGQPSGMIGSFVDVTERQRRQEELRASQERLANVVNTVPDGIIQADRTGRIIYANAAAEQVLRLSRDDITRRSYDDPNWKITALDGQPFPHDDLPFSRVMRTGLPVFKIEHAIHHPDGTCALLSINAAPVRDATGVPDGMVASITDITGPRRAVDALRDNEQRLRLALTGTNQGLVDLNLQTGEATVTPEYVTMLGYDPAGFRLDVDRWTEMLHPEDRARALATLGACIAGETAAYSMEYRLCHRDGGWVWVLSSGTVAAHDPAGRPVRLIGIHFNITARKQAEQALRETEFFLNKSQEVAKIGSYKFDATTGTWISSPSLDKIFGISRDATKTVELWQSLVAPDQRAEMHQYFVQHVLIGRHRFEREYRIVRLADQQERWVFGQGEVDYDTAGHPLRMIGTIQDITDRKRAEQARLELERRLLHAQKLESLGILAGGIAHDFNNLLMAILGNLDLALLDLSPVSPARVSIEQSVHAAHRAADLTRQMLAYSGKGSFVIQNLDLSELVKENAHLFRACISKLVSLDFETAPDLSRINADPGQIQQVIMNLITNASEAIGSHPGIIRLRTGMMKCDEATLQRSRADVIPPAGQFVLLEVVDTGCGMDETTQQRLFDPFFTTKFTGRGLGMSALLGIVRGHGGAIFVESAPCQGTTVRVLFPAVAATAAAAPLGAARPPGPPPGAEPIGSILVVDDEDIVRRVCSQMLTKRGWRVRQAADGLQAIDLVRQHAADIACVLLDLSMPHMGGIETFHALRLIRPDLHIILTSGYTPDPITSKLLGADRLSGFIQKPYSTESLLRELEHALKPPPRIVG